MSKEQIQKSIEKVVDEILAKPTETKTEEGKVEKAMPTSVSANGGEDKIRSGSPNCEEQAAMDKKKEEAKKAEDDKEDDEDEKKKKEKMKKAEDDKEDKDEDKDDKKDMKKKMKKSIEELSAHLDDEELELVKAWREETSKEEPIVKAAPVVEEKKEDLAKSLAKVLEEQIAPLKKAIEDKDAALKGLTEKVEKMASQPAYDRRSISNLETLEKSGATQAQEVSKSQVLEKMLELQLAGKGVTSHHIGEFEATKNISDPRVRELVFKELNIK